ncbi:YqzM family protein [Brevibacillus fluminis]|uniref:YqzM family protein n=1 Tax=Brevibacillus fluminis TaxID=511487 RepID=A0A3M8DJS2_9BACL|nr:YqzM family protein [Brevibacillus fluminis]RNB87635.1 YqzM family protein [Brevibacillus fluminis]
MAGSNFKKDMNQNDIVDSARAFSTSFGILFLVFIIALVGSIYFPPKHEEQATGGATAPSKVDAEAVFKSTCAACHGQNLEGIAGPNLTKVGSKHDAKEIENIIKNGRGGMPPGMLKKADEIKAVAEWLAAKK